MENARNQPNGKHDYRIEALVTTIPLAVFRAVSEPLDRVLQPRVVFVQNIN